MIKDNLFAKKDSKAYCTNCDDLVFVFCQDILSGSVMSVSSVYSDKGQAPFVTGEKLICKKCHTPLGPKNMRLDAE